jgi:hypothetical protein
MSEQPTQENSNMLIQRHASEIVQTVMMSVLMKEHPNVTIDAVASQLKVLLEGVNENS